MRLVEPLTEVRPPQALVDDPVRLPDEYQKTPHIVLQEGQWKFTSVCLFMRKPTRAEACLEWFDTRRPADRPYTFAFLPTLWPARITPGLTFRRQCLVPEPKRPSCNVNPTADAVARVVFSQ